LRHCWLLREETHNYIRKQTFPSRWWPWVLHAYMETGKETCLLGSVQGTTHYRPRVAGRWPPVPPQDPSLPFSPSFCHEARKSGDETPPSYLHAPWCWSKLRDVDPGFSPLPSEVGNGDVTKWVSVTFSLRGNVRSTDRKLQYEKWMGWSE